MTSRALRRIIAQHRNSTHARARTESVAAELLKGELRIEACKSKLVQTRKEVECGWHAISETLIAQGHPELGARVREFLDQMPPPRTERELIARELQKRLRDQTVPDPHRVR